MTATPEIKAIRKAAREEIKALYESHTVQRIVHSRYQRSGYSNHWEALRMFIYRHHARRAGIPVHALISVRPSIIRKYGN